MLIFYLSFTFLFGLAVGSFANVLIYRLPQNKPITGRSLCPKCKHQIAWYDNIPLISLLLLGGKCRHCGKFISWRYPLVELTTATGFTLITYLFLNTKYYLLDTKYLGLASLPYFYLIFASLLVIFVIDLIHQEIPEIVLQWLIPITLLALLASPSPTLFTHLFAAASVALIFVGLFFITRGQGLGWGDAKLVFFLGLFLGPPQIFIALLLSFLTGAIIGVILIIAGRAGLKTAVPFAPFLIIGTILAILFSQPILSLWNL